MTPRVWGAIAAVLSLASAARADPAPAAVTPAPALVDRVAVRYSTPETGGAGHPRFISERQLAFFARVESRAEGVDVPRGDYPARFLRVAIERLVAEDMLAALQVRTGVEPPDLPRRAEEAREELELRVGGAARLSTLLDEERIDESELRSALMRRMRAAAYVDRAIRPILRPSEEELRAAYRSSLHPLRSFRFEDVREELSRWLIEERLRLEANDFLQSARARLTIAFLPRPGERR